MIKLNLAPDRRGLLQFAWVSAFVLPLLVAFVTRGDAAWYRPWEWRWTSPLVLAIAGAAALQLVAALLGVPHLARWLYVAVVLVTYPIGFVLSHVLIAAIWYLLITPIGVAFRLAGRDVIGRRIDRSLPTYWRDRGPAAKPESYFKLY
jgi:hypothetical protein